MAYINTKTNQYPISEVDIRSEFPNTSFAIPFQAPEGYAVVFPTPQPTVENTVLQTARETTPVLTNKGNYEQAWEIVDIYSDYTDDEGVLHTKAEQEAAAIAKDQEQKKEANKARAMQLLKDTDWVEFPSVSDTSRTPNLVNFEEFMIYRMALRSIAVNPSYDSVFPELPQEIWSQ